MILGLPLRGVMLRVSVKAIKGKLLLVRTIELWLEWRPNIGGQVNHPESGEVTPQEGCTTPSKEGSSYTHAKEVREIIIP